MPITMAQANAQLRKLPDETRLVVQEVAGVTAFRVVEDARGQIPIGPGRHGVHLRDAVTWKFSGAVAAVVRVAHEAFHWRYLEFGARGRQAVAMFRKAKARNSQDHEMRLFAALGRSLNKLGK